jgi:hypothetical protein
MIPENELESMDLETVNVEIERRYELLNQMVGWLYPSIVNDEIKQLLKRKGKLNDSSNS